MSANPFHRNGPSPGAHPNWDHKAFAPLRVPYALPSGQSGYVQPHGMYQGPRGVTQNPYILRARAPMIRKWLPASYGLHSPPLAMAWVQLSRRFPHVGILHAPGLASRPVRVIETGADARGALRAHVVHRLSLASEALRNPVRTLVATREPGMKVRVRSPRSRGLLCRVFPGAKACSPIRVRLGNPAPAVRQRATLGTILRQLLLGDETIHADRYGLEVVRGR